jgi:hypothetical protein
MICQTALVNATVLHGIYRHGCTHIRTWKFGRDHCEAEYELAGQAPTRLRNSVPQRSEEQHLAHDAERVELPQDSEQVGQFHGEEQQPPQGGERKSTRMSDQFRKSVSASISPCPEVCIKISDSSNRSQLPLNK